MTPKDLRTGMTVVTREGEEYLVIRDTMFEGEEKDILWNWNIQGWMPLASFTDDLKCNPHYDEQDFLTEGASEEQLIDEARDFDIVAVYAPTGAGYIGHWRKLQNTLLWTEIGGDCDSNSLLRFRTSKQ